MGMAIVGLIETEITKREKVLCESARAVEKDAALIKSLKTGMLLYKTE